MRGAIRQRKRGMVNEPEAAVRLGENLAWDEACTAALGEDTSYGAHGRPESKAAHGDSAMFRIDTQIGGSADFPPCTQELDHPNESTRGRNDRVAAPGAEPVEYGTEERIFEGLSDD